MASSSLRAACEASSEGEGPEGSPTGSAMSAATSATSTASVPGARPMAEVVSSASCFKISSRFALASALSASAGVRQRRRVASAASGRPASPYTWKHKLIIR